MLRLTLLILLFTYLTPIGCSFASPYSPIYSLQDAFMMITQRQNTLMQQAQQECKDRVDPDVPEVAEVITINGRERPELEVIIFYYDRRGQYKSRKLR